MKHKFYIIFISILLAVGTLEAQPIQKPIYKNPAAPTESRINDLLGRMTLEEKLRQIDVWHPKYGCEQSENSKQSDC